MSGPSGSKVTINELCRRLGVRQSATQSEVKKAFYEKQKVYHPDKGGNEEVSKRLNEAYRILTDDELRAQHEISNDDDQDIYDQDTDKPSLMCYLLLSTILKKKIKKWVKEFDSLTIDDNFHSFLSVIIKNVIKEETSDNDEEDEVFCSLCEKTFATEDEHYEKAVRYYDDLIIDSDENFDYSRDSIFALLRSVLGDYNWRPEIYSDDTVDEVWNNPLLMGIPLKFENNWLPNWYEISEEALASGNMFMAMVAAKAGSEIDSDRANELWMKIGFKIFETDPLKAHVCFLSSCCDLNYIADKFFVLRNHKAAITYYVHSSPLDVLMDRGTQMLNNRQTEGFRYFSVVLQVLDEIEDDDDFVVGKLIQMVDNINNFREVQKEKLYRAIILTFPESFHSPVTLPIHNYLLEDAKDNLNLESAKILLAAAHFPIQTNISENFVAQNTKDLLSKFLSGGNFSFTALSEHLAFVNSKTVGALEEFLRDKTDFSRFGTEMRAMLYAIKAVIYKIAGEWELALESIEKSLTSSPGSLDKVTSCVANIFQDTKFHENILKEMVDNLIDLDRNLSTKNVIDVTRYHFLLTKTTPDELHKFSNIFQITGNLATLKKNEAGIKNRIKSKVESALYYYDLTKAVGDATSVIGVLLMSMSKFLEAISACKIPARIYAYRNAISEISRTVYVIALKYETPYMKTYAGRVAMSIVIAANQKLSQAVATLNCGNKGLLSNLKESLSLFSPERTKVALMSQIDLAIFELFLKGNMEIAKVNPIVTTKMHSAFDMIYLDRMGSQFLQHFWNKKIGHGTFSTKLPFYLYAYHRFDAVWHKWFTSVDFDEARKVAMNALLETKGWAIQDPQDLMEFPFIRRTPEGWLDNENFSLNLGVPENETFSSVDGYEMNLENGEVKLLFSQGPTRLFSLNDVNEVFERGITWGFFTLDEPDCKMPSHPFYNGRYFPHQSLTGSSFLQTMAYVDLLLKQFTLGVEINSTSYFEMRQSVHSILKRLPLSLQNIVKAIADRKDESTIYESAHRFWVDFSKGEMEVFIDDKNAPTISVQFGEMPVKVKKHLLKRDENGELVDDEENDRDDTPEGQFAREFTENYYAIGKYFPEMLRLTELMKLCVLNKLLIGTFASKKQEIKDMQTKTEFRDVIRSSIVEFQGQFPCFPILTEWKVSSEMSSVLAANGVGRHQVAPAELTRVENSIRTQLANSEAHYIANATNELSKAYHTPSGNLAPHMRGFLLRNASSLNAIVDLCVSSVMTVQINKREQLCKEIVKLKIQTQKSDEDEMAESINENIDKECSWYPAAFLSKTLWKSKKQSYSVKVHGGVLMNVGVKFVTKLIARHPAARAAIFSRQIINRTASIISATRSGAKSGGISGSRNSGGRSGGNSGRRSGGRSGGGNSGERSGGGNSGGRSGGGNSGGRSGGGNSGGRSGGGNSGGQSGSGNSGGQSGSGNSGGQSGSGNSGGATKAPVKQVFHRFSTRKAAKEAAQRASKGKKPVAHGPHKPGYSSHYHQTGPNGKPTDFSVKRPAGSDKAYRVHEHFQFPKGK